MINCCSLYGEIGNPDFLSINVKTVSPIGWPSYGSNLPLNWVESTNSPAMVSEVSKVSTEIDPRPLSTFSAFKLTNDWVKYLLVPITEISLAPRSINVIDSALFVCISDGIEMLPSDSILTSPNSLNPAGWTVSLIKSLQMEIGVLDLIT